MTSRMSASNTTPHSHGLWRIQHAGAVTCIGTSAWQSAASWAGMQKRMRKLVVAAVSPHPVTIAPCPEITEGAQDTPRLAKLLGAALADLVADLQARPANDTVALPRRILLAVPQRLSADDATALWRQTLAALERWAGPQASAPLIDIPCTPVFGGHGAGYAALQSLGTPTSAHDHALLLAVDSLLDETTLVQAHARSALLTDSRPHGRISGEAAAALLLRAAADTYYRDDRHLVLHAPALARGAGPHRLPQQQADAAPLAQVLRGALDGAGWKEEHVGCAVSDFDGSDWRAAIQIMARARLDGSFQPDTWEPAAMTGQVGAATGPLHWALAAQRLRHDARPPNSILSWALDEGEEVAAVALERTIRIRSTRNAYPIHSGNGAATQTFSARFLQSKES